MKPVDPRFAKLLDIQHELDTRKLLYAEFDKIVLSLVADGVLSAEMENEVLEIVDHFASENVGWTRSAVRRYDLEVTPKALIEKRARLAAKKKGEAV